MCFWFGLEILRLVYKKCFLKYWTVSIIFDLLSLEKSSAAPYENWKKISSKLAVHGVKRSGILRWSQKFGEVSSLAKGKKILQKNLIFRDLENFAKNRFSEKKSLGTSWRKSSTHFWNQRKIPHLACGTQRFMLHYGGPLCAPPDSGFCPQTTGGSEAAPLLLQTAPQFLLQLHSYSGRRPDCREEGCQQLRHHHCLLRLGCGARLWDLLH